MEFKVGEKVKLKPWEVLSKRMLPIDNVYYDKESSYVLDIKVYNELIGKHLTVEERDNINEYFYLVEGSNLWFYKDWLEKV